MAGLEDLYRDIIMDHYRSPRNRGELASPPALRAEGFNPLCGDEVILTFNVDDGHIADIAFGGQGCSISQAAASMLSGAVKGMSLAEVAALNSAFKVLMSIEGPADEIDDSAAELDTDGDVALGDLQALSGVVKFPVRIKCATLPFNTLLSGLDEAGLLS